MCCGSVVQDIHCCEFYAGVQSIVHGFRGVPSGKNLTWVSHLETFICFFWDHFKVKKTNPQQLHSVRWIGHGSVSWTCEV